MSKSEGYDVSGIKHNEVFQPCYMNDLLGMEFTSPAWIIDGLVPTQGITIISGAPKSFKSWISLEFALRIAQGQKVFGQYECTKNNVLIVDEENHMRFIQDRLKQLGAPEDMPISFVSQKNFCITDDRHIEAIEKICNEREVDVVILDSLVRMHSEEENSAKEVAGIFAQIKKLCQKGKTVIVLHHERKEGAYNSSTSARMRGSSDISAAIDSHIAVKKYPDNKTKILVDHAQCRCAPEQEPFDIVLAEKDDGLEFQYVGQSEAKKRDTLHDKLEEFIPEILKKCPEGMRQQEVVKILVGSDEAGQRTIRSVIKVLVAKGVITQVSAKKGNAKLLRLVETASA